MNKFLICKKTTPQKIVNKIHPRLNPKIYKAWSRKVLKLVEKVLISNKLALGLKFKFPKY